MAIPSILLLTDGTTTIDLLNGAFHLQDWTPMITPLKSGGAWQDSPLTDGRRMTYRRRSNGSESFSFVVSDVDQDSVIQATQDLRRLCEKALDYWTSDWQLEPVWIVAAGPCETNTRYAIVRNYSAERDDNPYQTPFYGEPLAAMDEFSLVLERADWTANAPGTSSCVQLSNEQSYYKATTTATFLPTQSGDDIDIDYTTGTGTIASVESYFGLDGVGHYRGMGVRFRNVTIPVGATILSAVIRLTASANEGGGPIYITISGDRDTTPGIFSTYADYITRFKTTESKLWTIPNAATFNWILNTAYDSPDISNVVGDIIKRTGWAAGNDMAFFLDSYASSKSADYRRAWNWDDLAGQEPQLIVTYVEAANIADYGRSATCSNEVYLANRHNEAQITHSYYYDASIAAWSANLQLAALPQSFLPIAPGTPPAANDIVYFGCNSTLADSGPFGSVVFDIGTAAVDVTGGVWEYYNGAWVALPNVLDQTNNGTGYFTNTGVVSATWPQPADWTTVAINGVTCYWVRFVIAHVGAAPTAPIQQNRHFYAALRNNANIAAAQVLGDIPALARHYIYGHSENTVTSALQRLIIALRSDSRGSDFRSMINLGNGEQNAGGITIENGGVGVSVANDTGAASGSSTLFNPGVSAVGWSIIHLGSQTANYYGRFRLMARMYQSGANTDTEITPYILTDDGLTGWVGATKTVTPQINNLVMDFGIVQLPPQAVLNYAADVSEELAIWMYVDSNSATPSLYLRDVWLVPIDEWIGDYYPYNVDANNISAIGPSVVGSYSSYTQYADVDSIHNRRVNTIVLRPEATGNVFYGDWQAITAGPAILQANKAQNIHLFTMNWNSTSNVWYAPLHTTSLQTFCNPRYLSMRGAR